MPVTFSGTVAGDDYTVALTQGGWSYGRPEDVEFLKAALRGHDVPTGIMLRKHGRMLSKEELKEAGYRASMKVSHEFLQILTPEGRKNPTDAAQFVVSALMGRQSQRRQRERTQQAMGRDAMVQVISNNMAAGPCKLCKAMAAKPIPLVTAPIGPLPGCPHPDQCTLYWRTILDA